MRKLRYAEDFMMIDAFLEQPARVEIGDGGGSGGGVARPPISGGVVVPAPTDNTSSSAGLGFGSSARVAAAQAKDNAGVLAGEADVDVSSITDPAEFDPSTGRRRPTRAAFMSRGRGGAGLKV